MGFEVGRLRTASLFIAFLAFLACSPETASDSEAAVETTALQAPLAEEIAPHEMTCAEIQETLDDPEMEEEASYLAVWAYGVRTGAKGLDFERHPVNQAGLEDFMTRLVLACKTDEDKLFVDAILE